MGSTHELRARACPKPPDRSAGRFTSHGHTPDPNSRFGYKVIRALDAPTPTPVISRGDVTPDRILAQINGVNHSMQEGSREDTYGGFRARPKSEYDRLRRERVQRKKDAKAEKREKMGRHRQA